MQPLSAPVHILIGDGAAKPGPGVHDFSASTFANTVPVVKDEAQTFLVAVDQSGEVHRLASVVESDRAIVAALAGSWIAQGLRVSTAASIKDLLRILRRASKAERDAAPEEGAQATVSREQSSSHEAPRAEAGEDFADRQAETLFAD